MYIIQARIQTPNLLSILCCSDRWTFYLRSWPIVFDKILILSILILNNTFRAYVFSFFFFLYSKLDSSKNRRLFRRRSWHIDYPKINDPRIIVDNRSHSFSSVLLSALVMRVWVKRYCIERLTTLWNIKKKKK